MREIENVFPFFWIKGESKQMLAEEIDAMYQSGLRAFCIESRIHPDFCGERWFDDVAFILAEAKKRDMQVWLLDDQSYPTGIANNILQMKYPHLKSWRVFTRFLDVAGKVRGAKIPVRLKEEYREELFGAYLVRRKNGKIEYDTAIDVTDKVSGGMLRLDIPLGEYRVYFVGKSQGYFEREWYIDMMNAESVSKLVEAVYESHYERFKEYFGTTFVGFFSDEPRLGNHSNEAWTFRVPATYCTLGVEGLTYPYSEELEKELELSDRKEWLLLWLQAEETAAMRCKYMTAVTKAYSRNFNQALSKWCHDRSVLYCGHIIEDAGAHLRTFCSAGHYFRAMEGADMAGIDIVSHQIKPYENNEKHFAIVAGGYADPKFYQFTLAKLASSSANLDPVKKGKALCEAFGAYGWCEGTKEMLYIANHLLSRGINYFIPHAFTPTYGNADCPPHFYGRGKNPAYEGYQLLFAYMKQTARMFTGGKSFPDVAVLYHDEAEWSGKPYEPCDTVAKLLTESQIEFDIVYSDHLQSVKQTENGFLIGERNYRFLVVPSCEYLTEETLALMQRLGDRVVFAGKAPSVTFGVRLARAKLLAHLYENGVKKKLLTPCKGLRVYEYEKTGEKYALWFNEEGAPIRFIPNVAEPLYAYDCMAKRAYRYAVGERVVLEPGQAVLVGAIAEKYYREIPPITKKIVAADISLKASDGAEFAPYKQAKIPFDINLAEEQPDFCGHIRYEMQMDLDKMDTLFVDFEGEYLLFEADGKEERFIGGRAYIDVRALAGKKRVALTTANTLSFVIDDGRSRYSFRPAACIYRIACAKEK